MRSIENRWTWKRENRWRRINPDLATIYQDNFKLILLSPKIVYLPSPIALIEVFKYQKVRRSFDRRDPVFRSPLGNFSPTSAAIMYPVAVFREKHARKRA